jgi:hypothetical protein
MTNLLDRAIEKTRTLPASRQDELGAMLLELVDQDSSSLALSLEQQAEVRRRVSAKSELVPLEEMEAFFRKLT